MKQGALPAEEALARDSVDLLQELAETQVRPEAEDRKPEARLVREAVDRVMPVRPEAVDRKPEARLVREAVDQLAETVPGAKAEDLPDKQEPEALQELATLEEMQDILAPAEWPVREGPLSAMISQYALLHQLRS